MKLRSDHRGVPGVDVDEAFEFDSVWAPLQEQGQEAQAEQMDDDEW